MARKVMFGGGRIRSMRPGPDPEVVVVDGGRIVACGPHGLADAHPDAQRVDLHDNLLVPGFIDAHQHLCLSALQPEWADLRGAGSVAEILLRLRAHAARRPATEWVRGFGWDEAAGVVGLDAAALDDAGLDRPVLVAHHTLHKAVVCSGGLDRLGLGLHTPDPPGGLVERRPDGSPSGQLLERAWSNAHAASLGFDAHPDRWGDLVVERATLLLAEGITAVHDAACPPVAEEMYAALARAGRLPVSVLALPHSARLLARVDRARLDGPCTGDGDARFRVGPVKLFADGGVSIAVDSHMRGSGERVRFGDLLPGLGDDAVAAVAARFGVSVHAMGNRAVDACLEAFTRAAGLRPDDDHRFRIEHVGLASKAQAARLAAVGGTAVVQPAFVEHMGGAVEGLVLDDAWLPNRTLLDAGVVVAGSSDDPCAPMPPIRCATAGETRLTSTGNVLDRDESVGFEQWLHAYTAAAAHAGRQEHERGAVAPGLVADFVVLEDVPDAAARVVQTWVGGELVYEAPGA